MTKRPDDRDRHPRKTPPSGVAAQLATPLEVDDEATGKYEGEALLAARARRSTDDRLARLEQRADGHDRQYSEVMADLSRIGDELADVAKGLAAVAAVVQDRGRRPSGSQGRVEDAVEATLAKRLLAEQTASRDFRRRIALLVIGAMASGGGGLWLLQRLLGGG